MKPNVESLVDDSEWRQRFVERISHVIPSVLYVFSLVQQRNVWVNKEVGAAIGYSEQELQAMGSMLNIMHPEDLARMPAYIEQLAVTPDGVTLETEYRLRHSNGEWRWFMSRDVPFSRDATGRVSEILGTATDITQLKRAAAQQQEAAREKDEFIVLLAHELRNPLAPIRTSIAMLKARGSDDAAVVRSHEIIDRQMRHMSRLLDDLLDVSRLSRKTLTLQRSEIAVMDVVEAAIEVVRPSIDQRQQSLSVFGADPRIFVDADAGRMAQALSNVLSNASKYSPADTEIRLSIAYADGHVSIAVRDSGMGISPDMLDRVFDMFTQEEVGQAHSQGGLGIGLALARTLIEMHSGTIRAVSVGRGKGSEFTLRLPALRRDPSVDHFVEHHKAPDTARNNPRVLIVDDNEDAADSLALLLQEQGCEARAVYDGHTAIAQAGKYAPDLILLDLSMPGLNGYETCRQLREQISGDDVTICALTGHGDAAARRRSEAEGFDRHLLKPVDLDALLQWVRDMRSRHR
jgi:PAS domain S-box-containing protein